MQKIVVADDVEVNREILRNMLEKEYDIEMAEDGEQVLQKVFTYKEDICALLLDLNMPKISGFDVITEMKKNGLMDIIPVLIITGERSVEIENKCFELGVADFIHKPFVASIVKNRIKNTAELFNWKNQLEQKVKIQTETLQEQHQIIELQEEKLKKAQSYNHLMMQYQCAIMEVETKLRVLNEEFSQEHNRNPFESIKSRLKSPESIYSKLRRKGYSLSVENVVEYITDVAGIRVICSFPDDIYRLAELLTQQDDILILKAKDYIQKPKPNGYRSLHLILAVPIFLSRERKYVKVEVQFRTIAMDFWASLEHKLKYKKDVENAEEIVEKLRICAESIETLDYQMQDIRDKIDSGKNTMLNVNDI